MNDDVDARRQALDRGPLGGRAHLVERHVVVAVQVRIAEHQLCGVVRRHRSRSTTAVRRVQIS